MQKVFSSIKECMKQSNKLKPKQKLMLLPDTMNTLKQLYYTNRPNDTIKEKVDVLRNFKKLFYNVVNKII